MKNDHDAKIVQYFSGAAFQFVDVPAQVPDSGWGRRDVARGDELAHPRYRLPCDDTVEPDEEKTSRLEQAGENV